MVRTRKTPDQTLRLERGEGKGRVFWEISRRGTTITTRFGKYLSRGRTEEKELASAAKAEERFATMIADQRAAGYGEPPRRVAAGAASIKGVSVRNAELEAAIHEHPDDVQGYLVYADWLQERGDACGELIVIQHARSIDPDDRMLERSEAALFEAFEEELLATLVKYRRIRTPFRSIKGLEWRWGFLRAARLRHCAQTELVVAVREILEHPSGAFLRRLVFSRGASEARTNMDAVFDALASAPPTLDAIVMGDNFDDVALGGLWLAMPRLRRLVLASSSSSPRFGDVRAEALEDLTVMFASHGELASIAGAHWPKLTSLSVSLTMPTGSEASALAPLLASRGLPSLADLTVHRWVTNAGNVPVASDALALETLRFAATRGLRRLELHTPMSAVGARALLEESSLLSIGSIVLPANSIADASLRTSLTERFPNIVWSGPFEFQELERLADD